jgi:hypothetical protein
MRQSSRRLIRALYKIKMTIIESMSSHRCSNTTTIPGGNDGVFVSADFLLRHMVTTICRDGTAN